MSKWIFAGSVGHARGVSGSVLDGVPLRINAGAAAAAANRYDRPDRPSFSPIKLLITMTFVERGLTDGRTDGRRDG